jgi:hypothetical protein
MLPKNIPKSVRTVRTFEVITPTGRVYQFPRAPLLVQLANFLGAYIDVVAISATILVLIYVAGFAAEALDRSTLDACQQATTVQLTDIS